MQPDAEQKYKNLGKIAFSLALLFAIGTLPPFAVGVYFLNLLPVYLIGLLLITALAVGSILLTHRYRWALPALVLCLWIGIFLFLIDGSHHIVTRTITHLMHGSFEGPGVAL